MKILDRYIIRNFLTTFLFVLTMFVVIAAVFDFSERLDDFIEEGAPARAILIDYYGNFIPYLANLFSPLFIFISVIYFTSRMAYNNEIIAILAGGVNFYRMLVPYFLIAILLTSTSYYLNGWAIPSGNQDMVEFELQYIRGGHTTELENVHKQVAPGEFIYMQTYRNQDSTGQNFTLEKFDDKELKFKLQAREIAWNQHEEIWVAHDYRTREIDSLDEKLGSGYEKKLDIELHPSDFGRTATNIQMMTNSDLSRAIELERLRGSEVVNFYIVEKEKRNALPFSTFILILIGVSIASKKVKGGMGLHLGLGILLAFSYLLLLEFSTTFALNANFPARLAVWLPNILYAILGIYLLYKAPK